MADERDFDAKSELRDAVAALLMLVLPPEQRELIPRLTDMVCACKGVVERRGKLWGRVDRGRGEHRGGVIAHEIIRTGRSAETGQTLH